MGQGAKMAYGEDLRSAAKRHLRAADELCGLTSGGTQPGCRSVAGYLFGLSGELALKEMMRASAMTPSRAHFPELKTHIRDTVRGRRAGELRKIAETPALFQYWNIDMRYAPTQDIGPAWVDSWRASAHELVDLMELP